MLLLSNSQIISQTTNTKSTQALKCYPESQTTEWFKGLKQGEYLKTRLEKTEKALKESDDLLKESKDIRLKQANVIEGKNEFIQGLQIQCAKEKEIKDLQIKELHNNLDAVKKQAIKTNRKKFWSGVTTGTVIGSALTITAILLLNR